MALPTIFANLQGNQPASLLDQQFAALALSTTIVGAASGSTSITLTPASDAPTVPAYRDGQFFSFIPAGTPVGPTTVQVGALAAKKLFKLNGTTQIDSGGLNPSYRYLCVYESALDGAAGGFRIMAPPTQLVLLQSIYTDTAAMTVANTAIPADNSIPQNTEGAEAFNLAITPASAGNAIRIRGMLWGTTNGAIGNPTIALFRNSEADAFWAALSNDTRASANGQFISTFETQVIAGSASAITYRCRFGPPGGVAPVTLNSIAGAAAYGGVGRCSFVLEEFG